MILALIQIVAGFGDTDTDTDIDADTDADIDADADAEGGFDPLGALGIGKVPLMLVLIGFLGSFGALGLVLNALVGFLGAYPVWGFWLVLVISIIAALPLTGSISKLFARFASRSSTAISLDQLVGRVGHVVSSNVSSTYGRVAVRDIHGSLHTVFAVIEAGQPIPEQSEVALIRYDEQQRRFVVRQLK
ncbi:MAG: hypothetical protein Fur005_42330 [Roseiflexaceae bacterium]